MRHIAGFLIIDDVIPVFLSWNINTHVHTYAPTRIKNKGDFLKKKVKEYRNYLTNDNVHIKKKSCHLICTHENRITFD